MEIFLGLLGLLLALGLLVFFVGGAVLGWWAYYQLGPLKREVQRLILKTQSLAPPAATTPHPAPEPSFPERLSEPVPEFLPATPPLAHPEPELPTQQIPLNFPPGSRWEKRFLENWTGILGLVVITLGLGFLGIYTATVLSPLWRFVLIASFSLVVFASGQFLLTRKPKWMRWGCWLQSLAAAVFLFGCLGSGGIPGMAWVVDPLQGLGLLLLGVAVNFTLAFLRKQQPYLSFHAVLSLTALAVPEPNLLLLAFLTVTALLAIGFSWFQRWAYNRAVSALLFQTILLVAHFRLGSPDSLTGLLFLAASAIVALLVHAASYRKLERGTPWSRPAFLTHVVNAASAGAVCAVWMPHTPAVTFAVLVALSLALFGLAGWARRWGTWWLYRTDRLLALAVAATLFLVNPLGSLPLVLLAAFLLVVLVATQIARVENDALLSRAGEILLLATVALLIPAAVYFNFGATLTLWAWNAGACLVAGAGVLFFLVLGKNPKPHSGWLQTTAFLLPAVFTFAVGELLWNSALVLPLSPGVLVLIPWVAIGSVGRKSGPSLWLNRGWALQGLLINLAAWLVFVLQNPGLGTPSAIVAWGGPLFLLTVVPLLFLPSRGRLFAACFLAAQGFLVILAGAATYAVFPGLPLAPALAVFAASLGLGFFRSKTQAELTRYALWNAVTALAFWRVLVGYSAPTGIFIGVCDALTVAWLMVLAFHRRWGPSPFWELALVGALVFFWTDLPRDAYPLLVSVLAVAMLVASKTRTSRRFEWYSVGLFLLANGLTLIATAQGLRFATLGTLIVYLLVDSQGKPRKPVEDTSDAPVFRRYLLVLIQAISLALALPTLIDERYLTLGWSLEAFLLFLLALVWKDGLFKNTSFLALGLCLLRLLFADLSASDVLVKALTFLSVGALMVGMNVLYLRSKDSGRDKSGTKP